MKVGSTIRPNNYRWTFSSNSLVTANLVVQMVHLVSFSRDIVSFFSTIFSSVATIISLPLLLVFLLTLFSFHVFLSRWQQANVVNNIFCGEEGCYDPTSTGRPYQLFSSRYPLWLSSSLMLLFSACFFSVLDKINIPAQDRLDVTPRRKVHQEGSHRIRMRWRKIPADMKEIGILKKRGVFFCGLELNLN
jgi:hypothetical protein